MHPREVKILMLAKTFLCLTVILCASCRSYTPVTLPNGEAAYTIKCGDKMTCVRRAETLCPHGYHVVESEPGHLQTVQCDDMR